MDPMTVMAVAMAAKNAAGSMNPKPMQPPPERLTPAYGQPMQGPAANYDPRLVPGAGVTAPAPYMGQQPPMDFGQMAHATADSGLQYMPPASSLDRLRNTSRSGRSRIDGLLGGGGRNGADGADGASATTHARAATHGTDAGRAGARPSIRLFEATETAGRPTRRVLA